MKKMMVPIIAVLLVVVGGVAYMVFFKKPAATAKAPAYFTYALEDSFLTNVKDSQSLFKTSITLKVEEEDKEKQTAFLTENTSIIRDSVLFLLREETYEELRADDIREKLSAEITELLNQKLGVDYIKGVYFNEYVVQ